MQHEGGEVSGNPMRGFLIPGNHRIIEWPGLQRSTVLTQLQPPAMCRVANQQPRLPRATSSLALNACRDGASTPPWATCASEVESSGNGMLLI